VTCIPVLVWDVLGSSRWSGRCLALEIGCEHSLPPGPVVACVVAPDVEAARDTFVAEYLCHTFVVVPALIVNTCGQDVGIAPIAVEIPGVADVGEVVHGNVEVAVVVVVAGEKVGRVKGSAHREHGCEDVWMAEGDVHSVIAAEAGADGAEAGVLVLLAYEGTDLVHDVLLILDLTGDSPTWRDVAVVPAFVVDRVDAVELKVAVFELVVDGVDHAAIFKLEETALGGGKDNRWKTCVSEDEQLHISSEGG
jgi:hypothetical protein